MAEYATFDKDINIVSKLQKNIIHSSDDQHFDNTQLLQLIFWVFICIDIYFIKRATEESNVDKNDKFSFFLHLTKGS